MAHPARACKFDIMFEYCTEYGMTINPNKSQFMVVNGNVDDKMPITIGATTIDHCKSYTYLGTIFTVDGKFKSMLSRHISDKYCNVLKLYSFVSRNGSMPFTWKRKVFDACMLASYCMVVKHGLAQHMEDSTRYICWL